MKLNVIPAPNKFAEKDGIFSITAKTPIVSCAQSKDAVALLNRLLESKIKGYPSDPKEACQIIFEQDDALAEEAYILDINDNLVIKAGDSAGFLNAVQTLRQVFCIDTAQKCDFLNADCMRIEDAPQCKWRGFMLDISRHFFSVDEIKRVLDLMALCKLNVFHFHFADDQGYRIESKAFPKLNQISSKRADTQIGGWKSDKYRGTGHEGFLTFRQVKDIVAYASKLNITVVPELNLPGHFSAILAAYPELSCTAESVPVRSSFGIFDVIACAGKPTTYDFIYALLDELCTLFPAPYFHIGGDEAPKSSWKTCPHCQQTIKENGLADEDELQVFMTNKIATYLAQKNKRAVVWYSTRIKNLNPDVIVQYWAFIKNGDIKAEIAKGRQAIASKCSDVYLDYPYAKIPLKKIYETTPYIKEFAGADDNWKQQVLGIEAPLWTEWVYDREKLDFNCFPRLCALAEVAWSSKKNKNYKQFLNRLMSFDLILKALGVNTAQLNIAKAKNYFKRLDDIRLWDNSDQYSEVRRNRLND